MIASCLALKTTAQPMEARNHLSGFGSHGSTKGGLRILVEDVFSLRKVKENMN